jgi:hypothetical protein
MEPHGSLRGRSDEKKRGGERGEGIPNYIIGMREEGTKVTKTREVD